MRIKICGPVCTSRAPERGPVILREYTEVSQNWGGEGGGPFLGVLFNKHFNMLGSVLGSAHSWNLPYLDVTGVETDRVCGQARMCLSLKGLEGGMEEGGVWELCLTKVEYILKIH